VGKIKASKIAPNHA